MYAIIFFNSSKTYVLHSSSPEKARVLVKIWHWTIAFNTKISREALFHSLWKWTIFVILFLESKNLETMNGMQWKALQMEGWM